MCGILFAVSVHHAFDREVFEAARDRMVHRGPDAAGAVYFRGDQVALGHRRLSIIDLSEAANQPMRLGHIWVTFNGEIYNYRALRKELEAVGCRFATQSDTEVLLHGYRVWGGELCSRLVGMFAFAIWNEATGEGLLGRDHVGQKPLFYAQVGDTFAAASEIKALTALLGPVFPLRHAALLDTNFYDYVPDPYTWYEGILSVEAGHYLRVVLDADRLRVQSYRYWCFAPPLEPAPIVTGAALDILRTQVRECVESHLVADVEVGALLSGGTDSNCVVGEAAALTAKRINTFSIGFGSLDGDELPKAREAASLFGTEHHEHVVTEEAFQQSVGSVLDTFDQPFFDTSLVPMGEVSRLAAESVKVVLTGDGGDEVFGGYNYGWYRSPFLEPRVSDGLSRQAIRELIESAWERAYYLIAGSGAWASRPNFLKRRASRLRTLRLFADDVATAIGEYDPKWAFEAHQIQGLDPFRQAQWLGIKLPLVSKMLVKVDRCTMAHSLESRAPFLSPQLIQSILDLPSEVTNPSSNWFKGLFRQSLVGRLPDSVLTGKKRGFSTPKRWRPIDGIGGEASLNLCLQRNLLSASAMARIERLPKLHWKLMQINEAMKLGLF